MRVPRGPSSVPQFLRSGVRAIEITTKPAVILLCEMYYIRTCKFGTDVALPGMHLPIEFKTGTYQANSKLAYTKPAILAQLSTD